MLNYTASATATERLQRYLEDERGECRDEDADCRLEKLDAIVDVSESGLSHALSALVDAGLAADRKDGRWKTYRATARAVALVTVLEGCVGDA